MADEFSSCLSRAHLQLGKPVCQYFIEGLLAPSLFLVRLKGRHLQQIMTASPRQGICSPHCIDCNYTLEVGLSIKAPGYTCMMGRDDISGTSKEATRLHRLQLIGVAAAPVLDLRIVQAPL